MVRDYKQFFGCGKLIVHRQAKNMPLPPEIFTIVRDYLSLHDISSLILTNREVNKWVDMNDMIREYYISLMDGGNIIEAACKRGYINLLTHLHHTGDSLPYKAVILASKNGHLSVVEYLHKNGANISTLDDIPIRWASENGHLSVVEYLHKNGANISACDNNPIKWASKNGHLSVVEYLRKNGARL